MASEGVEFGTGRLPAEGGEGSSRRLPPWTRVAAVFVALLAAVGFLLAGGADEAFVYSKQVHEVLAAPGEFAGRPLRVEGDLKDDSVVFREEPCEWRFVLSSEGREMPVRYPRCVVPDTFQSGMGLKVVVEGRLQPDGSFLASQVIPKCPSKYDPDQHEQLKRSGKRPPHQMNPS